MSRHRLSAVPHRLPLIPDTAGIAPRIAEDLPIWSEPLPHTGQQTDGDEAGRLAAAPIPTATAQSVPPSHLTGTTLGGALLAYMLGVTLIITLLPFQFDWPTRWRVMLTGGAVDVIANVLLFTPLGFLFRLARRNAHRHSALTVLWVGALVSMGIESAQLFEQERYASVLDVATNAMGAWLGAVAFDRMARTRRVDGRLIGRLSLELPLMGLIYLLVPLLWLSALSSGGQAERSLLGVLLGVFGATLLGGIQRHHFGPVRGFRARATALGATLWYLVGGFPSVPSHPTIFLGGAAAVAAVAWWLGSRPLVLTASNRRFEVPLLVSSAPVYGTYLLILTLLPLTDGLGGWQMGFGLPGVASQWTKVEILRFLELVASSTLVGYIVAEHRGRVVESYREALPRLLTIATAAIVVNEGIRGFHAGHGASAARGLVLLAATLYGGWLYYLQRRHVLQLLAEDPPTTL